MVMFENLRRRLSEQANELPGSPSSSTGSPSLLWQGVKAHSDSDDDRWERERAFDIADSLESGLARETITEFVQPLPRSRKSWKFHVIRSGDKLQHSLFSHDGDFLMCAKVDMEARRVNFFVYNPEDKDDTLFNAEKPPFTMTWSKDKTEWNIVQERCEHCQFSPRHLNCSCLGKQQVAWVGQRQKLVGGAIFNRMDVHIPGIYADSSRIVWCPLIRERYLSAPVDGYEAQRLITKEPTWNEDVERLVLDFKGRNIVSSAKNFQLILSQKPEHVLCQYGKIDNSTFSLDMKYPLSIIQAFGISLSTLFWT